MEDGDVALFLQLALDLKAARRRDILQVHAAERAGDHVDGVHDLVHILALDAERECIHIAERLEEHAFALHHGHARLRADVAKAQHRRAVRHHKAHVVPAGQLIAFVHVLLDLKAGLRHARRIGQRKILLGLDRHGGDHLDLAAPFLMQAQGFLCIVHRSLAPLNMVKFAYAAR